MPLIKLLSVTAAFAFAGASAAQSIPMKPGLWEISIAEHATDTTRTTTARVCYSAEDVKSVERIVPVQRTFATRCDNRDIRPGPSISWRISCTGKEGSRSGTASMSPGPESYAAQVKLDVKGKGKTSKVEQAISGKRVGDCP